MCFDRACDKPDVMSFCQALRIEIAGVCVCVCVGGGVTPPRALHPRTEEARGPRMKRRRSSNPPMSSCFHSGMGLFIDRSVEKSGFVITVTFLKMLQHLKVSWGWMAKDGHVGVWDTLEHLG